MKNVVDILGIVHSRPGMWVEKISVLSAGDRMWVDLGVVWSPVVWVETRTVLRFAS